MTTAVFRVAWGAATDRGRKRDHNEDAHLALPPVFMVADGMGGHQRGDAASARVTEAFETLCTDSTLSWLTSQLLHEAVLVAVERVRAIHTEGGSAPGSTLAGVGLALQGDSPCWLVFNIGDSRTYRLARGVLEQVSVDHSEVQELVESGSIDKEQARTHAQRSVITRALGAGLQGDPVVDQWLLLAATGDRLLVCSDGLTGELSDPFLAATLASVEDPQAAADALVTAAVEAGGRDNVTAVVVDAVEVVGGLSATGPTRDSDEDTLVEGLDLEGDTIPGQLAFPESSDLA
ncbi:MAG: serine/threonine-protein phosphatase [Actinomycetales bacterium]|nr:serine/threonine-protein phosphatase [Actinomycetales bacterium]